MLEVSFKFTPNIINKGLEISKVFSKKDFKVWPYDKSAALITSICAKSIKDR